MCGWLAFLTVLSVISILSLDKHGVSSGLVGIFLYGYSFLVLHSLRENYREEIAQGINVQIKQANPNPPQYVESSVDQQGFGQQASYSQINDQQQYTYNP